MEWKSDSVEMYVKGVDANGLGGNGGADVKRKEGYLMWETS
jgi:hypothetical protein